MTTGIVFDIKKFAIHDGPGIRTTVFLKGCSLRCLWCHNPESLSMEPEISFVPEKCIGCGYCFQICPYNCHAMEDGKHVFRREACTRCGKCTLECYAHALEPIGREMSVETVMAEVLKDRPFYETSNGGMTISGGEPLAQFAFTKALFCSARAEGLHTCLDTSGYAPWERLEELLPLVHLFLYDIKESDPERHEQYTGVPLQPIRENLESLDRAGAALVLRCPIIPGLNDRADHFAAIADLANALNHVQRISIAPYHPLGQSKCERLGKAYSLTETVFPDEDTWRSWIDTIQALTRVPVKKG